mmetsp:Transcript_16733/g.43102  ORF Transcript_16733/g.43102 Transcript_16733/m.43102 type:complete len:336 (-) Transcript_16733:245-1252(-)
MVCITKGIYGLTQAGRLAQQKLHALLLRHGYHATKTPCLYHHPTEPIAFTIVVDDFGVKWNGSTRAAAQHLLTVLRSEYEVQVDWTGSRYLGMSIDIDRDARELHLSIPGYVENALSDLGVVNPKRTTNPLKTPPRNGAPVSNTKNAPILHHRSDPRAPQKSARRSASFSFTPKLLTPQCSSPSESSQPDNLPQQQPTKKRATASSRTPRHSPTRARPSARATCVSSNIATRHSSPNQVPDPVAPALSSSPPKATLSPPPSTVRSTSPPRSSRAFAPQHTKQSTARPSSEAKAPSQAEQHSKNSATPKDQRHSSETTKPPLASRKEPKCRRGPKP